MSNENKRTALAQLLKRVMQIEVDLCIRARLWAGIAPRITGPIIGTDSSELLDPVLHQDPVRRKLIEAILDYHRGRAFAGAVYMQFMAAEVYHLSRWGR